LLSVDGLHRSDLTWFVREHPQTNLATLGPTVVAYTDASTPVPSDPFPA